MTSGKLLLYICLCTLNWLTQPGQETVDHDPHAPQQGLWGQRDTQMLHWHLSEVILNSFSRLQIQACIRKEMSILSVAANVLSAVNILLMCIAWLLNSFCLNSLTKRAPRYPSKTYSPWFPSLFDRCSSSLHTLPSSTAEGTVTPPHCGATGFSR